MSGSVNRVTLIGNLTRDPEVRSTQDGLKIVNMSVATSESWHDKSTGERRQRSEYHRVVIFNENLAGVAERFLRKGSKVYLEGQLQTRKWSDQQGNDRYSTEVVLQRYRGELVLQDSKPDNGSSSSSANAYRQASGGGDFALFAPTRGSPDDLDDEIPF